MNLVRVQDLADKAARVRARDWFDRFAKAYVGDAVARDNARDQLESHLIEALESDPQASVQRVDEALARLGVPEEFASLAAEMCRNGYFNGEDVRLDGAIRMAPK